MTESSITECKNCSIYFPAPGEVLIMMNAGLRFSENISDTHKLKDCLENKMCGGSVKVYHMEDMKIQCRVGRLTPTGNYEITRIGTRRQIAKYAVKFQTNVEESKK